MRVADYIFEFFANNGVSHIFMVSGGGAMHLNDALGLQKKIKYVCNLHEQASSIAAEGYARVKNEPGVVCVTTGPGGTNAITGVMGAWVDSIPMVVISGQVKQETLITCCPELNLRQLGDQEINIVDIVKPITKYAAMVTEKEMIRYHLEKAWLLAKSGRPGPVWLDIPLDIQAAIIDDPMKLTPYNKDTEDLPGISEDIVKDVYTRIISSKRPVIIAGQGVRASGALGMFSELINKLNVPVLTSISGIDLIPSDHRLFFGRPGILGERPANFIMQNSDLIIILGTRMNIRMLSYAYKLFGREAYKIMVDIDNAELHKPTLSIDCPIHGDVKQFIQLFLSGIRNNIDEREEWIAYCNKVKNKYPIVLDEHRNVKKYVNSYMFAEVLSNHLKDGATILTGNGIAYTSTFQAFKIKDRQRMFANVGCAAMGYDLPAAIGAAFAASPSDVVCITGDGSIQMNIQELQTIKAYNLPIKIFVFNNEGYLSIKHTQKAFFEGRFVGSECTSGVVLPELEKIANAYGIKYMCIKSNGELENGITNALSWSGSVLCEVFLDPFEIVGPKSSTQRLDDGTLVSRPLEDLAPILDRKEFLENMIIKEFKGI